MNSYKKNIIENRSTDVLGKFTIDNEYIFDKMPIKIVLIVRIGIME